MAKRIVQMHDKHKSTTNLYPKVTMGSLSPQVKAYIESAGDDKYVKQVVIKSEDITTTLDNGGDYFEAYINDTEYNMYGDFKIDIGEAYLAVGTRGADECIVRLGNAGEFKVEFTNQDIPELNHELTFDNEGNLKVDGQAVGGKQLYQHNITCMFNANTKFFITIINDNNAPLNSANSIYQWLLSKGFNDIEQKYYNEAKIIKSGDIVGCQIRFNSVGNNLSWLYFSGTGSTDNLSDYSIEDKVIAL